MPESEQAKKLTPVEIEEQILNFWDEHNIFHKSLEKNRDQKPYVFFDGPPFATGLPHYGHILGSTVKDTIPRYWTMRGRYVRRRWGWDCHGLPIEQLIEQQLGISGKKQIETLGIDKFNEACRANVLQYVQEWAKTVRRIGRFVEFDDSYKTMDPTYMESVWWGLKQIWEKDLIYEGRKVLLYCPRCETPLSNFEIAMDNSYDDVQEDSVYVSVVLKDQKFSSENVRILFWTTTPWTLPGNVALAVGKDIDYVLIRPQEPEFNKQLYILAKARVEILFNNPEILKDFKGSDLLGLKYDPIFSLPKLSSSESFKIYDGDFVTTEDGTGVVHTAVVYGEDDYNLGLREGLPIVPMINTQGLFNEVAPDFLQGKYYKKTEPEIIEKLKLQGNLFKTELYSHSVPFCWRCGTRLFYNAIPSWFINIQKIKPRLRELNKEQINWYPEHLKLGRFDKGLENAPDWNISRNRYWATPLPFWRCTSKSCGRVTCIGSLKELREKANNYSEVYSSDDINQVDLHRPFIDKIKLECGVCGNEMQRIDEVIDCWVESGSMPFAEFHAPFENRDEFERFFPAQFVSEYIPQIRAWFYVMHVISTILFDHAPFENVVTTGVVLAADGRKMSKSKKNFPDPNLLIEKYGADILRYYLLTSGLTHADNLNFNEKDLDELYKKVILILLNVHSFFRMYSAENVTENQLPEPENLLDQWILAKLHKLHLEVTKQLDAYDLVRAGRPIAEFITSLSTWYVRRSRDRIKSGDEDSSGALKTLGYVLVELTKLMAPFMPFISDYLYKDVTGKESVHLADWTKISQSQLNSEEDLLIKKMEVARGIVELGLAARKESNLKVRQPLAYLAYTFKKETNEALGELLERIIAEELNVKSVSFAPEVSGLPETILKENAEYAILLSVAISPDLKEEGLARELERQVQELRKKIGLKVGELVDLYYNSSDAQLELALINKFDRKKTYVMQIRKELEIEAEYETQVEIEGATIWLGLIKV